MKQVFYKRNDEPYSGENPIIEWGRDFENMDIKIVKQQTLENGLFVSTVWMGIDHSFLRGQPLIFETMVFSKEGKDIDVHRYCSESAAIVGHEEMVKKWSS